MRPPTEAASPVVTDGYGSTSTVYRRIVFFESIVDGRSPKTNIGMKPTHPLHSLLSGNQTDETDVLCSAFLDMINGAQTRISFAQQPLNILCLVEVLGGTEPNRRDKPRRCELGCEEIRAGNCGAGEIGA